MKRNKVNENISRVNRPVKKSTSSVKDAATRSNSAAKKKITRSDSLEYRAEKLKAVEKRKARSRSISMIFFTLIIMLLTVVLIMNVMRSTAPKPQFMFIPEGSIEHTITSTALIVRNENTLKAPVDGVIKPVIQEGNRVAFGETIAVIFDSKSDEALAALRNCEQQIASLQIELINQGKGQGAKVIYDEADREIAYLIDLVRKDSMQKRAANIDAYKASINVIMDRRDVKLLSVEFNDSRLNELKQQKVELEKQLGIVAGTLKAKSPGMVSYYIDGLEEILTPDNLADISIEQYKEFIKNTRVNHTAGMQTYKNEPILRVTSGIYQYIIVLIPSEHKNFFQRDTFHELQVPMMGTKITSCRVVDIIEGNEEIAVVFKSERQLERFSDMRHFEAQIVVEKTTGMRVPFSSVTEFNEKEMTGNIFLVDGGYIRKTEVEVVDYNREYAIVKASSNSELIPKINDYLVKNPESVREGDSIGGAR